MWLTCHFSLNYLYSVQQTGNEFSNLSGRSCQISGTQDVRKPGLLNSKQFKFWKIISQIALAPDQGWQLTPKQTKSLISNLWNLAKHVALFFLSYDIVHRLFVAYASWIILFLRSKILPLAKSSFLKIKWAGNQVWRNAIMYDKVWFKNQNFKTAINWKANN